MFPGSHDVPFELNHDRVSVSQKDLAVAWMRDPNRSILTVVSHDFVE